MRIEPIQIKPDKFGAREIRAFVEMVSRIGDLGVVLELDDEAYRRDLAEALVAGAPPALVLNLQAPERRGWTLFHESWTRINFWCAGERWLVAPTAGDPAGPIWFTEEQAMLDEAASVLELFVDGSSPAAYRMTEQADHRPVPGYVEPRPFLKRRCLVLRGGKAVLHQRLVDGESRGIRVRTVDYVLEAPHLGGFARFSQTIDIAARKLLSSKGPECADGVPF